VSYWLQICTKSAELERAAEVPHLKVSLVYPSMFQIALSLTVLVQCCFNAGTMLLLLLLLPHTLILWFQDRAWRRLHVLTHHGNHEVELQITSAQTLPHHARQSREGDGNLTSPIASTNANPKIAYENNCPRIDGLRATADRSAANTSPIPIPAPPSPMAALPMPMFWETWTMALAISDE